MPEISVGSQIFDLVFHPTQATLYTALLSGEVKGITYTREGKHQQQFSIKVSQKSCRGVTLNEDGTKLYVAGKGKGMHTIDTETYKIVETRLKAHQAPINRIKYVQPWLFSTGDDDGVIKLWDPRKKESIRTYNHHFDYITDFLWLQDTKHLVSTSGDGTLSVLDIRSKKTEPFAQSEDQEDELLSLVSIKGGTKVIVGTQIGVLSVFNRNSGWGDCVDRIPG
ncbi:WD40 repeat-like protein [Marasmius fiardii PR-910]|nr:WD40 repeat-like protein [Marasmius fiardii PR-910]